jgi:hypothetical protein
MQNPTMAFRRRAPSTAGNTPDLVLELIVVREQLVDH